MRLKTFLRKLAPRSIRPHRILNGPLRGCTIVTSMHDYPAAILGRTEVDLLRWISANVRSGETWLDVGAHYGYTALALAKSVGSRGRVFAFEPSISTAGFLNQTRRINRMAQVTVVPLGLGTPGGIRISSVPMERGMANHRFGGETIEDVYIVGFDDFWGNLNAGVVHGVKIDVQGMELEVIRGMVETLARDRPTVVVEFHAGVDHDAFADRLATLGYAQPGSRVTAGRNRPGDVYENDETYVFRAAITPASEIERGGLARNPTKRTA